jgi:hypothetical protein
MTRGTDGNFKASNVSAVMYQIEEGAIDRGAEVDWLSQFPEENEVR